MGGGGGGGWLIISVFTRKEDFVDLPLARLNGRRVLAVPRCIHYTPAHPTDPVVWRSGIDVGRGQRSCSSRPEPAVTARMRDRFGILANLASYPQRNGLYVRTDVLLFSDAAE